MFDNVTKTVYLHVHGMVRTVDLIYLLDFVNIFHFVEVHHIHLVIAKEESRI